LVGAPAATLPAAATAVGATAFVGATAGTAVAATLPPVGACGEEAIGGVPKLDGEGTLATGVALAATGPFAGPAALGLLCVPTALVAEGSGLGDTTTSTRSS